MKKSTDYHQDLLILFDAYVHGAIDRRGFLDGAAKYAIGGVTAAMLLDELSPKFAEAQVVPPDDKRLTTSTLEYDSPQGSGKMKGYLARPASAKDKKLPGVLVVHENRGLNPHIEDVARRLALEGFLAFAPDLLSISGGTPPNEDQARELHTKTDQKDMNAAATAAVPFMISHAESNSNVGAVGFCFGGGVVNRLAVERPDLKAAVAYYGIQPPADQVPAIRAALLLHYAGLDERINAGIAAYEQALKANGKRYTIYVYDGVNHAFNNDTGGTRYNKEAADLAWGRTVAFFKEQLGVPPRAA